MTTCPTCGATLVPGARFCESCGTALGAATGGAPALPADPVAAGSGGDPMGDAPISAPTRRPAGALADPPPAPARRPCAECGGEVGPDRYCLECGTKAPSERDHFRERPASWVAGVCDRGIAHSRNEDAMALLAGEQPGSRAVLIVLDGVSNSIDSDVASLAGARAAREVLRMPLPAGMGTPESRAGAVAKVLAATVTAANTAIVATTDPDSPNPASATFVAAVLEGTRVHVANIGDSRAYWVPDDGPTQLLSLDDSMAQLQIAAGVAREVAESSPQAHAITKWLGRDSPDLTPRVVEIDVVGPGWLLVCSDGLWNYASEPEQIAEQVRLADPDGTADPGDLALALVAFANGCGGQDNITAALARVPAPLTGPAGEDGAAGAPAGADDGTARTARVRQNATGTTAGPAAVPNEPSEPTATASTAGSATPSEKQGGPTDG